MDFQLVIRGVVRLGVARQGRAGLGEARRGFLSSHIGRGWAWQDKIWHGPVGQGYFEQSYGARFGRVGVGVVWQGKAWQDSA